MANFEQIETIEQLLEHCTDKQLDIAIALNGGCKSSKSITWDTESEWFFVFNDSDGSSGIIEMDEFKDSLIYEAMQKKALYRYL